MGAASTTGQAAPFIAVYMTVERLLTPLTDVFLFESAYIASRFDAEVGDADAACAALSSTDCAPPSSSRVAPNADAAEFVYVGELRAAKGVDIAARGDRARRRADAGSPRPCWSARVPKRIG